MQPRFWWYIPYTNYAIVSADVSKKNLYGMIAMYHVLSRATEQTSQSVKTTFQSSSVSNLKAFLHQELEETQWWYFEGEEWYNQLVEEKNPWNRGWPLLVHSHKALL